MNTPTPLSLLELQQLIKRTLDALPTTYWVRAEVNEMSVSAAGHCFMELTDKAPDTHHIQAKVGATIWGNVWRMLHPYFESATGTPLSVGMKVLVRVAVQYHELYGLRLNIVDIEPGYTVGEVEVQRRKVIARLQADGVLDMNKEVPMAMLPRRVAIVSSGTAAGYGDFVHQLHHNPYGYTFVSRLFAATMQGKDTEASIVAALDAIHSSADAFDVVVIIRGGGSQSDLSYFDSYVLASHVAQFPLPVIAGIGHDRDVSVVDLVAYHSVKTPTAAAEFLIEQLAMQDQYLQQLQQQVQQRWQVFKQDGYTRLLQYQERLRALVQAVAAREQHRIAFARHRLEQAVRRILQLQEQRLQALHNSLYLLDPARIIERGYTITLRGGAPISEHNMPQPGDNIETRSKGAVIVSEVAQVRPTPDSLGDVPK